MTKSIIIDVFGEYEWDWERDLEGNSENSVKSDDGKSTGELAWNNLTDFPDYFTKMVKSEKDTAENFENISLSVT
jgi:hypothetical protein